MAFEEKQAWALGVIAVVGYAVYVVLVLNGAAGRPLVEAPYVGAMLWTILFGIVAGIVSGIWFGIASRNDGLQADERDREIGRFGDHIGQSFVVIGGVFVVETLSVIAQVGGYRLTGRRLLACSPLHHHFQFRGMPETKIVVRFWIVAALLAIAGLGSLKLRSL